MLRLCWDFLLLQRELLLSCKIILKDRYLFDCIIDVIIYHSYIHMSRAVSLYVYIVCLIALLGKSNDEHYVMSTAYLYNDISAQCTHHQSKD